jgi:hypothetical protein
MLLLEKNQNKLKTQLLIIKKKINLDLSTQFRAIHIAIIPFHILIVLKILAKDLEYMVHLRRKPPLVAC